MKRIFTILCAAVLTLSVSAQAQFGVKAGLNSSTIVTTDDVADGARLAMQIGGVATIPFGDVVQLRTGVMYSQKGASDGDGDVIALDYLEMPADFSFMIGGGGFALSAGPYLGLLMSATADGDDISDLFNGIDMGVNLGASYTIAESMIIDARYGMGLTNVDDDDDEIILNGCLSVSFSYMFGSGY